MDPLLRELNRSRLTRIPTGWRSAVFSRSVTLGRTYESYENLRTRRQTSNYYRYIVAPEYSGWRNSLTHEECLKRPVAETIIRLVAVVFPVMSGLGNRYPLSVAHDKIGRQLERAGIPYLDLLETFSDKATERMAAFPGIDLHPSEVAHRVAAEAIFSWLLGEGHIDPSYGPRSQRRNRLKYRWLQRVRRVRSPAR